MKAAQHGALGERAAANYLRDRGYTIDAVNYRCRMGEVDIIARLGGITAFVEVKTRDKNALYQPKQAVTATKQKRFVTAAMFYLVDHPDTQPRFDVIEVVIDGARSNGAALKILSVEHIENAFTVEDNHALF